MQAESPNEQQSAPAGLFIVRGQGLRIPAGGFTMTIDENGELSAKLERIEVSLEMSSLWLRVALDQLGFAKTAQRRAIEASQNDNGALLASELEAECAAGMLAISSAAFAIDAFYAVLKDRSPRVASIPVAAGHRRPSRYKIVAEAIRREFKIGPKGITNVREILRQVYKFRDLAVHPRGDYSVPVLKPEIKKITEWRFVSFGASSAQVAVRATLALFVQIIERPRSPTKELADHLDGMRPAFAELASRWRADYGHLLDQ